MVAFFCALKKRVIYIWNNMGVNKCSKNYHFWLNYLLKSPYIFFKHLTWNANTWASIFLAWHFAALLCFNKWQCTFYESRFPVWYSIKVYSFQRSRCVCQCRASFSRYLSQFHESTLPLCTKTGSRSQKGGWENKSRMRDSSFCPCKVNGFNAKMVSRHSSRAVSLATATASHLALSDERSGQERVNFGTSVALPHWLCTSST